jgi:hypothetical protein
VSLLQGVVDPIRQFSHQARCVKGRGRLKYDADWRAALIEGNDIVSVCLVLSSMARILLTMLQQDLVQLFDVVFVKGGLLP